jgi:AraC-like DNA-binding protein
MDKAGVFLFATVAGSGELHLGPQCYRLQPSNRCWLIDLRKPRTYVPDPGRTLRTEGIRFTGPGVESWLELLGDDPLFEVPSTVFQGRQRRLRGLLRRRAPGFEWRVHLELTALLGDLLSARGVFRSPPSSVPPAVLRVLEAVRADPSHAWRARELTVRAGRSYSRLRDEFHRSQGLTLHAFLRETRLDLVRRLLSDPQRTIKEVALGLNFSSEQYFSHWFRRATGLSPTQFRERCRA